MKEKQEFCNVCKRMTKHIIVFLGAPGGFHCAEHEVREHCSKCGKEVSENIKRISKALGASSIICNDCK